jgi:pectate disaccharide-lyase
VVALALRAALCAALAACADASEPTMTDSVVSHDAAPPLADAGSGLAPRNDAEAGSGSMPADRADAGTGGGAGRDAASPMPDTGTSALDASSADAAATDAGVRDSATPPDTGVTTTPGDLWIAPDGDDNAAGTETSPLRSLETAVMRIQPGSTVWVRTGTYRLSQTVRLTRSGEATRPIRIFAGPGTRPVFDFSAQTQGDSAARGIAVSGSYFHLRGLELMKAGDNCINVSGSHNTFENLVIHECSDTGLQITANSSEAADPSRAAHNSVLNCDSYSNYDAANSGENADGFAAKLWIGPGNVFRGCRAWNNADDGWDLFASDDVVVIEDCWAIANGKIGPSQNNTNGDGNGFKLGGAAQSANQGGAVHKVTNCRSVENRTCGFTRNNNTMVPLLSMCGGRGDGKGTLCSLTAQSSLSVTLTAAQVIALQRGPDGQLP